MGQVCVACMGWRHIRLRLAFGGVPWSKDSSAAYTRFLRDGWQLCVDPAALYCTAHCILQSTARKCVLMSGCLIRLASALGPHIKTRVAKTLLKVD